MSWRHGGDAAFLISTATSTIDAIVVMKNGTDLVLGATVSTQEEDMMTVTDPPATMLAVTVVGVEVAG